jgi:D-tyrosyl-tRNA(Tyr) deacylase
MRRKGRTVMKMVIQRVSHASVTVDNEVIGKIGKGFLVFLGVGREDTKEIAAKFADKLLKLRIFEDENGKTNLNLAQVNGELLIVSQFTLYADTSSNRPGFTNAAPPALAEELYDFFVDYCKEKVPVVQHGSFGADMKVELLNDGPFTILL